MVWVRERLGAERVSERRACQVLGQARSTQRRERHIPDDETRLVAEMVELATHYGRYGYRRITAMLRWEGWKVNHKRVERLWRQEGLSGRDLGQGQNRSRRFCTCVVSRCRPSIR